MDTILIIIALICAAISGGLLLVPTKTRGGLTFWKIGRLGGCIYVSRRS